MIYIIIKIINNILRRLNKPKQLSTNYKKITTAIVSTVSGVIFYSAMMFKHTEYVNSKHRGKSFEDMSNMCKDINDIKNFQVDIRYKLNMLLHKYPNRYLLYIKNQEQERYRPGAHN